MTQGDNPPELSAYARKIFDFCAKHCFVQRKEKMTGSGWVHQALAKGKKGKEFVLAGTTAVSPLPPAAIPGPRVFLSLRLTPLVLIQF